MRCFGSGVLWAIDQPREPPVVHQIQLLVASAWQVGTVCVQVSKNYAVFRAVELRRLSEYLVQPVEFRGHEIRADVKTQQEELR